MKNLKVVLVIFAVMTLSSCSKEILMTTHIDGTYSGDLELRDTDQGSSAAPVKGHVRVTLNGINYTCSTNMNFAYASGSGKFFVKKDVMTFTDILIHPRSFDWNLVLNGSYTYTIKGDRITLIKKVGNKTSTFLLKKE